MKVHRKFNKKGDISESISAMIKLALAAIVILLAFIIGASIYRIFMPVPESGTLKTLTDFVETVNKLNVDDPVAKPFYVDTKHSLVAFDVGESRIYHFAGVNTESEINRPISSPPPRGCGSNIDTACICICANDPVASMDHCAKPSECRLLSSDFSGFRVRKSYDGEAAEKVEGFWGTVNDNIGEDGRYFVIFGDRLSSSAFETKTYWLTKRKEKDGKYAVYVTVDEPDIKPAASATADAAAEQQPTCGNNEQLVQDNEGEFVCKDCETSCNKYLDIDSCVNTQDDCTKKCDWQADQDKCIDLTP